MPNYRNAIPTRFLKPERLGPPFPASSQPGETAQGNDGRMYISEKRGISKHYRWYAMKTSDREVELVMDTPSTEPPPIRRMLDLYMRELQVTRDMIDWGFDTLQSACGECGLEPLALNRADLATRAVVWETIQDKWWDVLDPVFGVPGRNLSDSHKKISKFRRSLCRAMHRKLR